MTSKYKLRLPAAFLSAFIISVCMFMSSAMDQDVTVIVNYFLLGANSSSDCSLDLDRQKFIISLPIL